MSQEWKLVPVVPTKEMIYAIATRAHCGDSGSEIWSEALAWSPVPPPAGEARVCDTCHGQGEIPAGGMQHFGYNQPPEPWMMTCPECAGDPLPVSDDSEVQRYSLCEFGGGTIERSDGHLVDYDDHVARVSRLQFVAETCKASCDEMLQRAQQAEEERDILQARIDKFDRTISGIPSLARAEHLQAENAALQQHLNVADQQNDELKTDLAQAKHLLKFCSSPTPAHCAQVLEFLETDSAVGEYRTTQQR